MNDDLKPGDSVWVDGELHVFISEQEGLLEVGANGHTQTVKRSEVSLVPPLAGDPIGDPFNGLVEQLQGLVAKLKRDLGGAERRVARRRLQIRKLEQVVRTLTITPAAPTRKKASGPTPAQFLCKTCGNHSRSKAHKEQCGEPVAALQAGA